MAEELDPSKIQALKDILRACSTPENINHGYETCPSRRLKKVFEFYDKVRHGAPLAGKIGLAQISVMCPRFAKWLQGLESIGRQNPGELAPLHGQEASSEIAQIE